jgi:hypothetical protein
LLTQLVLRPDAIDRASAGRSKLAKIAMMAMTTRSSMRVKARFCGVGFMGGEVVRILVF